MLSKDIWQAILTRVGSSLRTESPKQWDALKQVCSMFRDVIWCIEGTHKLTFYTDVKYPFDKLADLEERLSDTGCGNSSNDELCLTMTTTNKIIAVRQLGRQPTHHWAPLLICEETFQLHLYEIGPTIKSPEALCSYKQHKAKLTAALSLDGYVVSADASGYVGIWQPPTQWHDLIELKFFQAHEGAIEAIDYISRNTFVTASKKQVKFWSTEQNEPIKTMSTEGTVKDLRALSMDSFYVLTVNRRKIELALYADREKKIMFDDELPATNELLICDELRLVTPQKIAGVIHKITGECFRFFDCAESENPQTTKMVSNYAGNGFLSRANYRGYFSKLSDEAAYEIRLLQEHSTLELMTHGLI